MEILTRMKKTERKLQDKDHRCSSPDIGSNKKLHLEINNVSCKK
jgi:hypothetical protein